MIAASFDAFLVDLDGVVWLGGDPLPGAVHALTVLREAGKELVFVTNDPRATRDHHAGRLTALGCPTAPNRVVTSPWALATFLAGRGRGADRDLYVVGGEGLVRELVGAGLTVRPAGAGVAGVAAVVVGGSEDFDYAQLRTAAQAVRAGAELFATNRDPIFPMPDGPWPGTGAVLAAVETAAGRRATVVGKPEPHIFELATGLVTGDRVAVVGDRVDSDVVGGNRAGLTTVLVDATGDAEGVHRHPDPACRPDLVVPDLRALTATSP